MNMVKPFNPSRWNPSYLAYCRSEGVVNPDDLPTPDNRKTYSFQEWMRVRKIEYVKANPGCTTHSGALEREHIVKYHNWVASLHREVVQ